MVTMYVAVCKSSSSSASLGAFVLMTFLVNVSLPYSVSKVAGSLSKVADIGFSLEPPFMIYLVYHELQEM